MYKQFLGSAAVILTLIAFYPYIRSIIQGKTKPHVFSWIIWGSTTFIVFLAQLAEGGGYGAWVVGISGVITFFVAILAYFKDSDKDITKSDCLFFVIAMASLPAWHLTSDPKWAVIILTAVDVLGFGPTFRRGYYSPFGEQVIFFLIMALRNVLILFALENYSMTTVLFPMTLAIVCFLYSFMIFYRRRVKA